jgi:predicted alpha/beta-hydrolase family hydrolase
LLSISRGKDLRSSQLPSITVPTLVISGGEVQASMREAVQAVAADLPTASYRSLEGQTHDLVPAVLAPALEEFFKEGEDL